MHDTIKRMKKRLREELHEHGMRPAELAEMTGISVETIRHYLSPWMGGGRLEIWLIFSEALGHEGLDWLLA